MAKVRPLSELPVAVRNMAAAAKLMPDSVVPVLAKNVADEVELQASGFYIKGRNGKPVKLMTKVTKARSGGAARVVGGTPIGAWHIIEGGSQPHLITGTKLVTTRRGNQRRVGARGRLREFEAGDAITGKPLKIPGIGFRQYAMHPGHRPTGQPWRKAMSKADGIVSRSLHEHASRDLKKAWLK